MPVAKLVISLSLSQTLRKLYELDLHIHSLRHRSGFIDLQRFTAELLLLTSRADQALIVHLEMTNAVWKSTEEIHIVFKNAV